MRQNTLGTYIYTTFFLIILELFQPAAGIQGSKNHINFSFQTTKVIIT